MRMLSKYSALSAFRKISAPTCGALALLACGCSTAPNSDAEAALETRRDPLYVAPSLLWANSDIPVCWETSGNATEKGWVRDAVSKAWEAEGNIEFTGWGQCNGPTNGIRIRTQDSLPRVSQFGKLIGGVTNGMTLNFWFTFDSTHATNCTGTPAKREACVRHTAVRTFGYALGFDAENNRPDRPMGVCSTSTGAAGGLSHETVGAFDSWSITYVCDPPGSKNGLLSAADIEGTQRYYGSRRPIAVESFSAGLLEAFVRLSATNQLKANGLIVSPPWVSPAATSGAITSAPSVTSWGPNRLDVFVRGTDRMIYRAFLNGSQDLKALSQLWPTNLGPIAGNPVAVSFATGKLAVFYRQLPGGDAGDVNSVLVIATWDEATLTWTKTSMGALTIGTPAAISSGPNRVDVFARGTDGALKTGSYDNGAITPLASLGSEKILGDPAVASSGVGQLNVFVRQTDGTIWTKARNGTQWEADYSQVRTEQVLGDPAAAYASPGELDVVVRGTDSGLYHTKKIGTAPWTAYEPVQPQLVLASPTLISWGPGRLDVFARGTDSGEYWASREPSSTWSTYSSLGNIIR